MAVFGAPDVGFVLLGGRSLAAYLVEIQDTFEAMLEETTGLGVSDDTWAAVGVNKFEAILRGIYNSTDFVTAFEVNTVQELMYCLEGNTIGNEGMGVDSVRAEITRQATRDALHRLEASFKATTSADKGKIMADHVARDDQSTATTTVDNAASNTLGAVGYLGVSALALGGYTNIIVKIRDSTDDNTFADLITFTAVTAAPASERVVVTGTVNRYAHTTVTWTGAGSSESATYAVTMRRGNQAS
tara:strand:+ start:14105 stop:14836 length:732 start_codon:yes stop_codon:yes gene_type:complete